MLTLPLLLALTLPFASTGAHLRASSNPAVRLLKEGKSSFDCHIWPWACEENETLPSCFSPMTSVQLKDGEGFIPMQDLRVGDYILTASGDYKPVYAFGHRNTNTTTDFLRIFTDGYLHPLEVTAKHLVYANTTTKGFKAVPADTIKEGDFVQNAQGGTIRVTGIGHIKREGLYAPFTTDGTLVVDGIVASSYISLKPVEYHAFFASRMHGASHFAVAPIRFLCSRMSSKFCELTTDQGIPYLFSWLEGYMNFIVKLWTPLHIVAVLLYLALALAFTMLEWVTSFDGILVTVCGGATYLLIRKAQYSDVVILKRKKM